MQYDHKYTRFKSSFHDVSHYLSAKNDALCLSKEMQLSFYSTHKQNLHDFTDMMLSFCSSCSSSKGIEFHDILCAEASIK